MPRLDCLLVHQWMPECPCSSKNVFTVNIRCIFTVFVFMIYLILFYVNDSVVLTKKERCFSTTSIDVHYLSIQNKRVM